MFKIPTVEKFSKKLVQKCKISRIPLSKPECGLNTSAINKHILKWKQLYNQNIAYQQEMAAKKRSKSKTLFTMNPLPDYTNKGASTLKKIPPPKPENLTRNLEYLTTDEYKRISPEFYKMLQSLNKQDGHNLRRKKTKSKIDPLNSVDTQQNLPEWARLNPKLYKYLGDVMNSENASNMIYGIDFQDNVDPDELRIKPFSDPRLAMDATKAIQLFKLLQSRETLTPEQLRFLTEFLRNFAYLGPEKFDQFMALLNAAGVTNDSIRDYMINLYEDIKSTLGPDQLRMVLSKLGVDVQDDPNLKNMSQNPNYDANSSQFANYQKYDANAKNAQHRSQFANYQKYDANAKNAQHRSYGANSDSSQYPHYGANLHNMSQYPHYGANLNKMSRYPNNHANLNKMSRFPNYGANLNKMSQYPNYGANADNAPHNWWKSALRRSTGDSFSRDSEISDLGENLSNSNLPNERRISPKKAKISRKEKKLDSLNFKRSSTNIFSHTGYYPPWNITPQWTEKPKFYRLSTATRRSYISSQIEQQNISRNQNI